MICVVVNEPTMDAMRENSVNQEKTTHWRGHGIVKRCGVAGHRTRFRPATK
jgi:hypothetical protein